MLDYMGKSKKETVRYACDSVCFLFSIFSENIFKFMFIPFHDMCCYPTSSYTFSESLKSEHLIISQFDKKVKTIYGFSSVHVSNMILVYILVHFSVALVLILLVSNTLL